MKRKEVKADRLRKDLSSWGGLDTTTLGQFAKIACFLGLDMTFGTIPATLRIQKCKSPIVSQVWPQQNFKWFPTIFCLWKTLLNSNGYKQNDWQNQLKFHQHTGLSTYSHSRQQYFRHSDTSLTAHGFIDPCQLWGFSPLWNSSILFCKPFALENLCDKWYQKELSKV